MPTAIKPLVSQKVPSTPAPKPAVGTPYTDANGNTATMFDAQDFLEKNLGLKPGDTLKLFHHAKDQWAPPGERAWVSDHRSGGYCGEGFYTSTRPEENYGEFQFQLEIPVEAFEGKKLVERYGNVDLPPGADIQMDHNSGYTWFIFKPGSAEWLNKSATQAEFDKPGESAGWNED